MPRSPKPSDYRAVFQAAPDGILVVDSEGAIQDVNPAALRQFGYRREELLGQPIEMLVPSDVGAAHRRQREEYVRTPRARPMGVGLELYGRRSDGSRFPVEISLSPLDTGGDGGVISVVRDQTERQRLREFGIGALRAAEDERIRIARELHDDTAQRLAALLVRLRLAAGVEEHERRAEMFDEIRGEIQEAAESLRRIARGLRPPPLDELGFAAALTGHAHDLGAAYDMRVEVDSPEDLPRLEPDIELAVYRIVQEALSNVVRHAGARRVTLTLAARETSLSAVVEDDGRGFVPEADAAHPTGLGLIGMRERARAAGGSLVIESRPGRGTRVEVEIPTVRSA